MGCLSAGAFGKYGTGVNEVKRILCTKSFKTRKADADPKAIGTK